MCCLGLAGKAARDKTLIISVKIEFPVLVPIKRALLRLGCAAEDFTHFFKSLERNSERDPAQNSKMKIRSKRLLPFSVTESSWPSSTLPCSHLQICKWRERNGAVCICIAHQKSDNASVLTGLQQFCQSAAFFFIIFWSSSTVQCVLVIYLK